MKVSLVKKITAAILVFTMTTMPVAFASDLSSCVPAPTNKVITNTTTNVVDNPSQLSAFQNVETCTVSVNEMNQVSGEWFGLIRVGLAVLIMIFGGHKTK